MITAMKRGVFMPQYTRDYTEEVCTRLLEMKVGVLTESFMLETMQWLYKFKEKRPIRCTPNVEMPMFRHLRMKEGVTLELVTHIVV